MEQRAKFRCLCHQVAVSHETAVSHVHLDSGEILNTVEIDFDFGPPNNPSLPLFTDVVMGKENYAYLFSSGQNPPTVAVEISGWV